MNYKVKLKLLVSNFPALIEKFTIDGFILKYQKIDKEKIKEALDSEEFNTDLNIASLSYQLEGDDHLTCSYFETEDYFEFKIDNKIVKKDEISEFVLNDRTLQKRIANLEKKLRITYNIPVSIVIKKFLIYDSDDNYITHALILNKVPASSGLKNMNFIEFNRKSKFRFSLKSVSEIEEFNENFKRSMDFFYNSFENENQNVNFILLLSAIESLFNLKGNSKKFNSLKEKIAHYSSKIMLFDNAKQEKQIYNKIIKFYKLRNDYLHGVKSVKISHENVRELRDYLREILIIYWNISLGKRINSKEMLNLLDSYDTLSVQTRLFIMSLRSENFEETKRLQFNLIETEIKNNNLIVKKVENGLVTEVEENIISSKIYI